MFPISEHWQFQNLEKQTAQILTTGPYDKKQKAFFKHFVSMPFQEPHTVFVLGTKEQIKDAESALKDQGAPYHTLSVDEGINSLTADFDVETDSPLDELLNGLEDRSHSGLIEIPESINDSNKDAMGALVRHALHRGLHSRLAQAFFNCETEGEISSSDFTYHRVWIGHAALLLGVEQVPGLGILMAQSRSFNIRVVYEIRDFINVTSKDLKEGLAMIKINVNHLLVPSSLARDIARDLFGTADFFKDMPLFKPLLFDFDEICELDVYLYSMYQDKLILLSLE